ncbi:MAG: YybS family protein [Synergistaceae bacterium]|jgi:uncharacterized protein YybS (DUF2232 family)|nr:YybS family protein [Synergistaceae bacterium]
MSSGSVAKDWFLCTVASFALFVLGSIVPAMMTLLLMLIYPFPLIFLTFARGARVGAFSCVTAAAAVFIATYSSSPAAMVYLLAWGLPGVTLGAAARRAKGAGLLTAGVICSLICKLAAMVLMWRITGVNILTPDSAEMEGAVMSAWAPMFEALPEGDLAKLRESVSATVNYIVAIVPSVVILFTSVEVLLSYGLASSLHARRGGEHFFRLPPFEVWSFPRNILVALIVGFICEKIGDRNEGIYVLKQAGANLGVLTWTLFAVQGLSVAYFFMGRSGFPKIVRVVIITLAPFVPIMGGVLSILGIADIGIDLRKRIGRK